MNEPRNRLWGEPGFRRGVLFAWPISVVLWWLIYLGWIALFGD